MAPSENTAATTARATLLRLSDSNLTVADPAEDVRGRKVLDHAGEEIGDVDDLLIDDRENKVRFLQVASGGFLGIGETKFLIPIDAVTAVQSDAVQVNQTREHVAGAPRYEPELVDEGYYDNLYGYYGHAPFWGPGYAYPAFPFYF